MGWDPVEAARELLGYVNFSQGKPDPRIQQHFSELYRRLGGPEPWGRLRQFLVEAIQRLRGNSPAFQDVQQAEAVTAFVFDQVLPAYRDHHRDLLFHLADGELLQPFFLARVFEAVLQQGGPWDDADRIVRDSIARLNDFVGHRPVPALETRKHEPYAHERVRPIPLYIRAAGVAVGSYHDVVARALDLLSRADPEILNQAHFQLDLLDELAVDPRAYDFSHPVNQRPNYQFGEWDPHCLDGQARYRRFVVRSLMLEALQDRVDHTTGPPRQELLFEAAAALAGTILMASGVSGSGPDTHDSSVTLETLVPRIARYRDAFYDKLLASVTGFHGERLRREAKATHQPFGGVRQHLNQYLARQRASQLQYAHLARMFAQMGYPAASQKQTQIIRTASARMVSQIEASVTTAHLHLDRGELAAAAAAGGTAEELLQRAIHCGAVVDPWNILGFQGQFSIFAALENSVPDPRVEQLTDLMEQLFTLYARLLAEAAAAGDGGSERTVSQKLRRLAGWWDQFASVEVGGVRRVHGREILESATHVAKALSAWQRGGHAAGNIVFWREHSDGFNSPRAYAQVVDALLLKKDHVAAMALLMRWLAQVQETPLEQGSHSHHTLAARWLSDVLLGPRDGQWPLVQKFFAHLEANAEDYWQVPALEFGGSFDGESDEAPPDAAGEEDDVFAAAYEGVSYRDSAEDGHEGETIEGGPVGQEFDLQFAAERIEPRLRFLSTLAELWQSVAAEHWPAAGRAEREEVLLAWFEQAQRNQRGLAKLLDAIHAHAVPEPLGSHDSMVEYDRRWGIKEQLIYAVISTAVEMTEAARQLLGCLTTIPDQTEVAAWELLAADLQRSLSRGEAAELRGKLPVFLDELAGHALLYQPLIKGGDPRKIVAAKCIQRLLRNLVQSLPHVGLLRETYHVLKTARRMEQKRPGAGGAITEFDHLFRAGFTAAVESLLDASRGWDASQQQDEALLDCLERMTEPFLQLWLEHSQTLRLSALERIGGDDEWTGVREFVETYGHDLLTPRFLTPANLRGILDQGVDRYLAYLEENPDPLHPIRLVEELGRRINRDDARRYLELVVQTFVEHYEEYKDYNSTTTHSDYGERFFVLLEFLRLKTHYERVRWNLEPVALAHELLARKGRTDAAFRWQEAIGEKTAAIADALSQKLRELETRYGVRLSTVSDRLRDRFIRPLTLDRLRVLVEPAMDQARQLADGATSEPFQQLERGIREYAATTTGVGWDVPQWLRVLEHEVRRVRAQREGMVEPVEGPVRVPRTHLSFEELERQLDVWAQPL